MNVPEFTTLRKLVDEAITFHEADAARRLALRGVRLAQWKECPAEELYFRAQLLVIDEKWEEAIPLLEKALSLNPTDAAACNDLALCRIELGRFDGALELFDRGIASEPDYATIHHNKGWFLNQTGHFREAISCFETALRIEPGRSVTWENMADAWESLGEVEKALGAYTAALESLGPSHGAIREQIEAEIQRLKK